MDHQDTKGTKKERFHVLPHCRLTTLGLVARRGMAKTPCNAEAAKSAMLANDFSWPTWTKLASAARNSSVSAVMGSMAASRAQELSCQRTDGFICTLASWVALFNRKVESLLTPNAGAIQKVPNRLNARLMVSSLPWGI